MKIVIAYLYYDLLNLYGEKGNLKEIIKELKNQDINYEIKYLSINDDLKFENYDLVIMNAGTENNQEIVIKHLKKYKKELKKAIENNSTINQANGTEEGDYKRILDLRRQKIAESKEKQPSFSGRLYNPQYNFVSKTLYAQPKVVENGSKLSLIAK